MNKKNILVTGGAGFIGSHLIDALLKDGNTHVTCIDNFDDFYSPGIKHQNIAPHLNDPNFTLIEGDICNTASFADALLPAYDHIVHLAAKAGVRPSLKNPAAYQTVNVVGLQNMLEIARSKNISSFIFGSSSSVYGINSAYPWSEESELMPISPYASSKIAGEWLGKSYSLLYGTRFLALRFFTVIGPRQRPDLAINKFTSQILNNEPISFYGKGDTIRDYTYVGDIVAGILSALDYRGSDFEIFNFGNNTPVSLKQLVETLELVLERKALYKYLPEQPGDVPATFASIEKAKKLLGYSPKTDMESGLAAFVKWYRSTIVCQQ